MRNTPFRMMFILIPAIIALFRNRRITLDWFIAALILSVVASEIFTLLHTGYNLVQYSLFTGADVIIVGFLVAYETKLIWIPYVTFALIGGAFLFFMTTNYSTIDFLKIENSFPVRNPMDTHQFFDFCAICNLVIIILCFIWLYHTVTQMNQPDGGTTKRFIYIFGLLGYFCGGFFTIAFGRYIVGDISIWFEYWNNIYLPLYFLFYLTLNIGLLWKPTPAISS